MSAAFLGLRTAKYRAPDIARAREWYAAALGIIENPHFQYTGPPPAAAGS